MTRTQPDWLHTLFRGVSENLHVSLIRRAYFLRCASESRNHTAELRFANSGQLIDDYWTMGIHDISTIDLHEVSNSPLVFDGSSLEAWCKCGVRD